MSNLYSVSTDKNKAGQTKIHITLISGVASIVTPETEMNDVNQE